MCKLKKYHGTSNTRVDKCLRTFIQRLKLHLEKENKIVACCCGHKKYPLSIIIEDKYKNHYDLFSGKLILRKRNFYKRDQEGYYYIPEVLEAKQ